MTKKIGPHAEIGVCDQCAVDSNFSKKPVRRLIPTDNIYLCLTHWEDARDTIEEGLEENQLDLLPFIRAI
jgi:hypothetical protein